ncbi:MAG: hypothetical protein H0X39_01680 [Actinobacteria bacterium]|nr:hypothetical protein [Actinomycetota bacterium]
MQKISIHHFVLSGAASAASLPNVSCNGTGEFRPGTVPAFAWRHAR